MTNDNTKAPEYDLSRVAAAYGYAAAQAQSVEHHGWTRSELAEMIRDLIPGDALAARDARDKRVRKETLRAAAEEAGRIAERYLPTATLDYSAGFSDGADMAESAILALIEKDKTDE